VFNYSPQGRLLTHTHQINNEAIEVLAIILMTGMGQLITNKQGTALLQ
jgi:hypothetical protein